MRSSILSQCRDLSTGVICSVLVVPVTARAKELVTGDEIFVFAVSLGKVSYNSVV